MNAIIEAPKISAGELSRQAKPNDDIWRRNEKTDPSFTKKYKGSGGFAGTSVNATYVVRSLTKEFGPIGKGWGFDVVDETMLEGAPIILGDKAACNEIVHRIRINFWWTDRETGERYQFPQLGQTTFVGKNKYGLFTDEEAPKKSLSDAVKKAASWLGFSGDIHLGYWDDDKYVSERRAEAAEEAENEAFEAEWKYWIVTKKGKTGLESADEFKAKWQLAIQSHIDHKAIDRLAELRDMNRESFKKIALHDSRSVYEVSQALQNAINTPQEPKETPSSPCDSQNAPGASSEATEPQRDELVAVKLYGENFAKYVRDIQDTLPTIGREDFPKWKELQRPTVNSLKKPSPATYSHVVALIQAREMELGITSNVKTQDRAA
jgi:hypothetical protein